MKNRFLSQIRDILRNRNTGFLREEEGGFKFIRGRNTSDCREDCCREFERGCGRENHTGIPGIGRICTVFFQNRKSDRCMGIAKPVMLIPEFSYCIGRLCFGAAAGRKDSFGEAAKTLLQRRFPQDRKTPGT